MTANEQHFRTALWAAIYKYVAARPGIEFTDAVAGVELALHNLLTVYGAEIYGSLEQAIRGGEGGCWPDWVYEARAAITHRDRNIPWLADLLKALGWQGGTIHQALNAVSRLVEAEKAREAAR